MWFLCMYNGNATLLRAANEDEAREKLIAEPDAYDWVDGNNRAISAPEITAPAEVILRETRLTDLLAAATIEASKRTR